LGLLLLGGEPCSEGLLPIEILPHLRHLPVEAETCRLLSQRASGRLPHHLQKFSPRRGVPSPPLARTLLLPTALALLQLRGLELSGWASWAGGARRGREEPQVGECVFKTQFGLASVKARRGEAFGVGPARGP